MNDSWAAGQAYEQFMGRWSRALASRFVGWLAVPEGGHWLDVGCGTGAMTDAIRRGAAPASVVGCDPAQPLLEHARRELDDPRVELVVAGVDALPERAGGFDAVVSCLALNFFPAPSAAVEHMRARCVAGGVVAACVWDYADGMQFLRRFWDAVLELDPEAAALDEGRRFPICRPDALQALFLGAGLDDVRCDAIEAPTRFASFDDYWQPFLGGTGPAPAYVAGLAPARRDALVTRLRRMLGDADGAIDLQARAWVVRGRAPV